MWSVFRCVATNAWYGKCVYTYPDKDFRLYPGVPRNTEHWGHIYKHRVTVERTINLLKDTFALADNRSFSVVTLKADLFLSDIVQLIGVILADKLNKHRLYKSIRKLIAWLLFVAYFFETVYSPPFLAPFFCFLAPFSCLCLHSEAFFLFWGALATHLIRLLQSANFNNILLPNDRCICHFTEKGQYISVINKKNIRFYYII